MHSLKHKKYRNSFYLEFISFLSGGIIRRKEKWGNSYSLSCVLPYTMVLISRHRSELCLCEDKCFEVFCLRHVLVFGIHVNYVKTGLIAMHRVENYLKKIKIYTQLIIEEKLDFMKKRICRKIIFVQLHGHCRQADCL